jgi:hypothetical protein
MSRHIQSANQHDQQLISIVTQAIRAAAMAPSDREALDIAGAALASTIALVKPASNQRSEAASCLFSAN